MRILLHICCGPCCIFPLHALREEGHDLRGYFFNPNIHPYTEFRQRLATLQGYAEKVDLPLIIDDNYELEDFLRQSAFREAERCRFCYAMRLKRAAQVAKKGNFAAFSTTLLVSPFQKHEMIADIGKAVGEETGIPFLYRDFRAGFKGAVQISKDEGMYRQQYCGCIYSERDRYQKRKR